MPFLNKLVCFSWRIVRHKSSMLVMQHCMDDCNDPMSPMKLQITFVSSATVIECSIFYEKNWLLPMKNNIFHKLKFCHRCAVMLFHQLNHFIVICWVYPYVCCKVSIDYREKIYKFQKVQVTSHISYMDCTRRLCKAISK